MAVQDLFFKVISQTRQEMIRFYTGPPAVPHENENVNRERITEHRN